MADSLPEEGVLGSNHEYLAEESDWVLNAADLQAAADKATAEAAEVVMVTVGDVALVLALVQAFAGTCGRKLRNAGIRLVAPTEAGNWGRAR